MTREEIVRRIEAAFQIFTQAGHRSEYSALMPPTATAGKLYEAYILARVAQQLVTREGMELTLSNGNRIALKSSPGPINRQFPRIDARQLSSPVAELWTDVEFLSLSCCMRAKTRPLTRGEYHELDIVMVEPEVVGRPRPDQIWLGVECKNTGYGKSLLREILGIRRELSLLRDVEERTRFSRWPRSHLSASPPSCLAVFCADRGAEEYAVPGEVFGIDFFHEELPV